MWGLRLRRSMWSVSSTTPTGASHDQPVDQHHRHRPPARDRGLGGAPAQRDHGRPGEDLAARPSSVGRRWDASPVATRVTSTRFVGRDAELAELRAALADARAGRPALAFVAGESGVGKTRLVSELQRTARDDGVRILSGDCVDLGEGELPFAPLVGALRPLARTADPVLESLPQAAREALRTMLPGLAGAGLAREGSDEASTARARLFEAVLDLLDRLGADDGLLLVIEDLHWADRATRAFITYLAAALCDERVLVVATYRPDELHRRHPLRPLLAEL